MIPEQKCSSPESVKEPMNVILITFDALNYQLLADNLSTLPNFLNLNRNSAFLRNAFSVGPSTSYAFPAILASVYPYHFGVGIDKNVTTIDRVLRERGYSTAVINEQSPLLTPHFGYGTHSDYQRHILSLDESEAHKNIKGVLFPKKTRRFTKPLSLLKKVSPALRFPLIRESSDYLLSIYGFAEMYFSDNPAHLKRRAQLHARFVDEVTSFLNQSLKTPQFLWIHTTVNHLPYLPQDNTRLATKEIDYLNCRGLTGFVSRGIVRRLKQLYIESLKTADKFLGDVMNTLSAKQLLDRSIVIVTADHGEEFMENGYFGHNPKSSSDSLLHVPLFFHCPQLIRPKGISCPISTINIMPTICDLLSIDIPASCRGVSCKNLLIRDMNPEELSKYEAMPLYSEAWGKSSELDRSPGNSSKLKIFTVRQGDYRLKLGYSRKDARDVIDKIELTDWKTGRKLDIADNSRVTQQLTNMLEEHLREEEQFVGCCQRDGEMQLTLSKEEEEEIKKKLKALGYLD